jgi:beta-glucanase (GH16 family)
MENETGFTTPAVAGNFNGWCGDCNYMTDVNGDNIWETTIDIPAGGLEYKFTYDNWAGGENFQAGASCTVTNFGFTNRYLNITGATVLDVVCYNSCSNCIPEVEPNWSLVWCDEFTGSAIDANSWTHELGNWGWGNNELQNYTASSANSFISNGVLNIKAIQENSNGSPYSSARLISNNKFEFQYGKVEARLKIPYGQGVWPAFWMLGENIGIDGWPHCGEIDIMEHINNENVVHGTVHWFNGGNTNSGGTSPITPNEFHTYGVIWNENYARFYVDDVNYFQYNFSAGNNTQSTFQKPFFLLLNLAIGGNWPGYPDGTTQFPATYEIDYVRVYESDLTPTLITTGSSQCSASYAANDSRANAIPVTVGNVNTCVSISGDLTEASASNESESVCPTGEDLWYSFTAPTSGIRIQANTSSSNLLLELQDSNGNLIQTENVNSTLGNEKLNFGGLTPGATYFLAVRNYNSNLGSGQFSVCMSKLLSTVCDYSYTNFSLCSNYKADYVAAQGYTFHFAPVLGGETISYTKYGSTVIALSSVAGLTYNTSYNVTIDAIYQLNDGLNNSEFVAVEGTQISLMNVGAANNAGIRTSDQCPIVKSMYSYIQETTHICGCQSYAWEVTRTDIPSLPMIYYGPNNTKFFQIKPSNGFQYGGTYSVRVSPVFGQNPPSDFGQSFCVSVAGSSNFTILDIEEELAASSENDVIIYPNPSDGNFEIITWDNENAFVTISDLSGRIVYQNKWKSQFSMDNLENGLYIVQVKIDKRESVGKLQILRD